MYMTCTEPYYTCVHVGLLVDVHVTLWRMSMEYGARCGGGRWLLCIVLILTSIMNGSGEYGDV